MPLRASAVSRPDSGMWSVDRPGQFKLGIDGGISAFRTPKPALILTSTAAVERNAIIGDDEAARKADVPIVQLNPGGASAWPPAIWHQDGTLCIPALLGFTLALRLRALQCIPIAGLQLQMCVTAMLDKCMLGSAPCTAGTTHMSGFLSSSKHSA